MNSITGSFCKNTGYEKALPIIDEWLENDNPNTRRAVTEGLGKNAKKIQ